VGGREGGREEGRGRRPRRKGEGDQDLPETHQEGEKAEMEGPWNPTFQWALTRERESRAILRPDLLRGDALCPPPLPPPSPLACPCTANPVQAW